MATSDPNTVLLAHDRWATGNLLAACAELAPEKFAQPFEMGPGSLRATAIHIFGAMRGWTDMLRGDMLPGKEPRPRLESEGDKTAQELIALHPVAADEFEAEIRAGSLADDIVGDHGGRSFTFTRGTILTHVTTHSMHHRAQCQNMLRRLGVDPLPASSVMEWSLTGEPGL